MQTRVKPVRMNRRHRRAELDHPDTALLNKPLLRQVMLMPGNACCKHESPVGRKTLYKKIGGYLLQSLRVDIIDDDNLGSDVIRQGFNGRFIRKAAVKKQIITNLF